MGDSGIESIQIHFNSLYANSYNNGLTSDCNFYLNNNIVILLFYIFTSQLDP